MITDNDGDTDVSEANFVSRNRMLRKVSPSEKCMMKFLKQRYAEVSVFLLQFFQRWCKGGLILYNVLVLHILLRTKYSIITKVVTFVKLHNPVIQENRFCGNEIITQKYAQLNPCK